MTVCVISFEPPTLSTLCEEPVGEDKEHIKVAVGETAIFDFFFLSGPQPRRSQCSTR